MDAIAQAVTYVSALVSLGLLVQMVRKLLKETPISRLAPIVSIGATLVTTLLYVFITGVSVNRLVVAVMFVLGLAIGCGEGQLTRLYYRERTLTVKRSAGYLVVWGTAYLLTVALDQLGDAVLHAVGILILAFGLGTALGSNVVVLVKQMRLRPALAPAATPPATRPAGVPFVVHPPQHPAVVPGVYAPPPISRRGSGLTCLILTILGILAVLGSLLAVMMVIYSRTPG